MVEFADVAGAEGVFARHEHEELRLGLDRLSDAAHEVSRSAVSDVSHRLSPIREWLTGVLIPHVTWEGAVIFPEVEDLSRNIWPTSVMAFDHMQIERAVRELERELDRLEGQRATSDERADVCRDLIALETLVRAHFEREEEFFLPILDGHFPRPHAW